MPTNTCSKCPAPLNTATRYKTLENAITTPAATRTRSLAKRVARKSGTVRLPHAAAKRRMRGATRRQESHANSTSMTAIVSQGRPYS